ncbi:MAG TPA: exodeoxyribonuclease VII large subunit [Methyloceanibacter sp.]|nr:exodeoxyribonuclease VII large subunit [Methyloceanibacter sp.]
MADRPQSPTTNLVEYTVSELAFALKRTVEDAYGLVKLRGEISGFRGQHSSGHCYFTLKDERACIEAVIWRSTFQRLKFKPEEGLEVIARGRVTTYPDRSKYQIVIDELEPAGVGALLAQLEERKKRLQAEGLFDEARKRPLPFLPRIIGVVTSPTGAVIRDILHRLEDRFPSHVLVWPVRVQGENCAIEVSAAVGGFNALDGSGVVPRPDLILVARGGGSLEDLWGFNDEGLARAVAASAIPLISAVGHETDWTIIDFVADWRAPTPTAAAERAVPVRAELMISVTQHGLRVTTSLRRRIEGERVRFLGLARGLPRKANILDLPRQRLDNIGGRLSRALVANAREHRSTFERSATRLRPQGVARTAEAGRDRLIRLDRAQARAIGALFNRSRVKLDAQAKLLSTLGYHNVLARGFALVRDEDGTMLRRATEVKPGAALDIEFADGHVDAHADAPARKSQIEAKARRRTGEGKQGTLL